jgi:hypothetical protein
MSAEALLRGAAAALAATLMLALAGCGPRGQAVAAPTPTLTPLAAPASPFKVSLSLHDVMTAVVDPAADALWASVASVTTKAGTEEHRPRSEDDWNALRLHAVRLAESANLLVIDGRPVVLPGRTLDDAGVPGVLDAAGVQQAIAANRPGFITAAQALHAAAAQALSAIDARNVEGLSSAGSSIDQACERCHLVYWYPNARRPPDLHLAAQAGARPAASASARP